MFHLEGMSTVTTPASSRLWPRVSKSASVRSETIRAFCASVRPQRIEPSTKAACPSGSSSSSEKKACTKEGGAPVMPQWMRTISLAIRARCASLVEPGRTAHR